MQKNFFYKIKRIFDKQTQYLLLFEIAAIILAATVALTYVFDYVKNASAENSVVYSWEYVYTDGSSNQYEGEWNIANSLQPMSTEKTADYLHMRGIFSPSEEERALIIRTDYSPVKIAVNGKTVYDNHYGESAFVGNTYNAVTIPASSGDTKVDISMALPFSANIRTEMAVGVHSTPTNYSFWLVSAAVVVLIGGLMLIASVILSFTKKRKGFNFIVSLSVIAYGVFSAVFALSDGSYLVNFSRFYNASITIANICILILLIAVAVIFKIKSKRFVFAACGYFLTALLILVPQSPAILEILAVAAGAVGIVAMIALANACKKLLASRIQYARVTFLLLCYIAMLTAACALIFHLRLLNIWVTSERLGGFILICFIVTVAAANLFSHHKNEEEDLEIENHDECVAKLAELIKNFLSARSETEICRISGSDICDLAECCAKTQSAQSKAADIAFCVAMRGAGGYQVIDSRGFDETVRFDMIENHFYENGSCYNFAETYFNFIFLKDGNPYIILYFQNIEDGLSLFFRQMMETVYSCMEAAFEQLSENTDIEQKKENGFVNLAENVELNSGSNADHLQCVADYTKIIMRAMDYPERDCETVSNAAMLHDIGKIAIPSGITNKSSLLTETERSIMKRHTEFGYIILSAFDGEFMQAAAAIAKDHHEQYDGKGYGGLRGSEIHEYARIVSVADVFDALTTQRTYKEAWTVDAAVEYINANSGKIFDPQVVSALNSCLDEITERYREKH